MSDIAFKVKKDTTTSAVNAFLKEQAETVFLNNLAYTTEPLVSADIIGNKHSAIIDSALTHYNNGLLKVVAWYDNETGYSCRLLELVKRFL